MGILHSNTLMRVYMAAIALAGGAALLLQFPLSIAASRTNGISLAGAIITYFSFFTILTNILVVVSLVCPLWIANSSAGRLFSRPEVITGIAIYIATVGSVYSLLLRQLWAPEGLQKIADVVLHDLVPVLYAVYWLIFVPKRTLRWKNILSWLAYPLAYLAFVLFRGAMSGRYPYHFIDVGALGYPRVFLNAALLLAAFLVVGVIVVAVGRRTGRGSDDGLSLRT